MPFEGLTCSLHPVGASWPHSGKVTVPQITLVLVCSVRKCGWAGLGRPVCLGEGGGWQGRDPAGHGGRMLAAPLGQDGAGWSSPPGMPAAVSSHSVLVWAVLCKRDPHSGRLPQHHSAPYYVPPSGYWALPPPDLHWGGSPVQKGSVIQVALKDWPVWLPLEEKSPGNSR